MPEEIWSELPLRPRFLIDDELAPPPPSYQDHQRNKRVYPEDIELYQLDRARDGPIPPLGRIVLAHIEHRSRSAALPPPYAVGTPMSPEILPQTQAIPAHALPSREGRVRGWVRRFGSGACNMVRAVAAVVWALTPRGSWFWGTAAAFVAVFGFVAIMGFVVLPS